MGVSHRSKMEQSLQREIQPMVKAVTDIYVALSPLERFEQLRAVRAAMALMGIPQRDLNAD